jgi:thiol-disulfide isomerase/thioredoxin
MVLPVVILQYRRTKVRAQMMRPKRLLMLWSETVLRPEMDGKEMNAMKLTGLLTGILWLCALGASAGSDVVLLTTDTADGQAYAVLLEASGISSTIVAPSDFAKGRYDDAKLAVCLSDCREGPWVKSLFEFGTGGKVLAMGESGAEMFGEMGLLVGSNHAWHGDRLPKDVHIPPSVLRGPFRNIFREPFDFLYDEPSELRLRLHDGPGQLAYVGIYDGGQFPKGTLGIAREVNDTHHWTVCAQGPYTLWGIDSSGNELTEQGRALFVNLAWHLLSSPSEPLQFPEKRFLSIGTNAGTLTGGGRETWYFMPEHQGTVVVTLEWQERNTMMFHVREPFQRKDGRTPLTLSMDVPEAQVSLPKKVTVGSFSLDEGESCPYVIRVEHKKGQTQESGIRWGTDFDAALAIARRNRKPSLVHLGAEWCGPCKAMKTETYNQTQVQEALRDFVCLDALEDEALEKRLGCSAYPTIVFLDSSGREVYRFSGYKTPEDFLEEVDRANKALGR